MLSGDGIDIPAESSLSPAILRGLGDRSYDKRKGAALEVEALLKRLQAREDTDRICNIIALLGQDFATSTNANHRKGGLIALAGVSIGLMGGTKLYLSAILPPVLHCLDDPEARVRYYACESLYNIAKVVREDILIYFNQIFDGLCKLFADVDVDVKNGSNLLDRLIKDIVTESKTFDVERFIPLLQKYIRRSNPYIRQLLLGWIFVLDSVPDISMVDWLPDFLDGLFNMISDGNREIRQATEIVLSDFLKNIKTSSFVELGPMVNILVAQCMSRERPKRSMAMTWIHEFIQLAGDRLIFFFSDILSAILHCISDPELDVRRVAEDANTDLMQQAKETNRTFELPRLLKVITTELLSSHVPTRMAALRWIDMLLEKLPDEMSPFVAELLRSLLKTLSDSSDEVVFMNLQVLSRIAAVPSEFERVLNSILELFMEDTSLLETRGSLVIRKLCVFLNAKSIYIALAEVLRDCSNLNFLTRMVQMLNLILLTAEELAEVRQALQLSFSPGGSSQDMQIFTTLFTCWCHNPVSTLSLCFLARAYNLSAALVREFVMIEVTVGFLMQIDKLVQLLEGPIFIQLRMELLDVESPLYPMLMRSLYGLLMLLPQSTAYKILRDRLDTACSLKSSLPSTIGDKKRNGNRGDAQMVMGENTVQKLLKQFRVVAELHTEELHDRLQERSLESSRAPFPDMNNVPKET
eukprot:437113_1